MNITDSSLLAACGGDTVKLFDVSAVSGDPCTLSYSPSPGCVVNSVKWNHTNLVVASAGDDKKISLWRKNGESMGTIPLAGTDTGDGIEESIFSISFGNKGSRYVCSGGSGKIVRIWDLQRKCCIKRLKGHTDSITGLVYNCKDEHLASISLSGDLIIHNLVSGARAAELKDPHGQILRVLDYSRISRHLLATAGDDGSVHLWDTTGRAPKLSWLKQHSAPTAGIGFSPSSDKMVASVGLDKKLYFYDSGSRRPSACIPYDDPFSSLAFRDDGWILAAGTTSGRVVFYDVRGKPQPFTVLRAYGSSEAVSSICWQRSKPVRVNEKSCTAETALLGATAVDSILMPDPLPSVTSSSLSVSTASPAPWHPGRSGPSAEICSHEVSSRGSTNTLYSSTADETPQLSHVRPGGKLARLQAPRSIYNFKDDMEVFSPLVDVQPMTPSVHKLWDNLDAAKDFLPADKKPSSLLFPSFSKRFSFTDDGGTDQADWKSIKTPKQDDNPSSFTLFGSTSAPSSNSEDSSITPPEAWGGDKFSDKYSLHPQPVTLPSWFRTLTTGSMLSGLQDPTLPTDQKSMSSLTSSNLTYANMRNKDAFFNQETSLGMCEHFPFNSTSVPIGTKSINGQASLELAGAGPSSMTLPRRFSTYAERISTIPSFTDGTSLSVGSPKTKRTGVETREELLSIHLSRFSDTLATTEPGTLPALNGGKSEPKKAILHPDSQPGSSFTLQLFQRTLEETLGSFQKSVHEDMRNLHIEMIRQFHIQEMEMSSGMNTILKNQAELMKEIQSLRKENQQLRQML